MEKERNESCLSQVNLEEESTHASGKAGPSSSS